MENSLSKKTEALSEKTVITERWSGQRSSHGGSGKEGPEDGSNVAVGGC